MTTDIPLSRSNVFDVAVVGAGPAGLATALALVSAGGRTLCAGQRIAANPADTRTTALLQTSVRFLENLGVWRYCTPYATALEGIRLLDDTEQLIRAPEVEFHYRELGDTPFGFNIANTDLVAALADAAATNPALELIQADHARIARIAPDRITLALSQEQQAAVRLVAAADGRRSACRDAARIATRTWSYDQSAIACNFTHSGPHDNFSNEFHREAGPFTTVPLSGNASSLVWVERPNEAKRLMHLDDETFCIEIEQRLHGLLGEVEAVGRRAVFPLSGLTPAAFARNRVALVGEAAHVLPPIGAQGLNLGFRDAAVLAGTVGRSLADGEDPGGDEALRSYHRARRSDVLLRTAAVDMLNRSLLSHLLPIHALRGAGLNLLRRIGPLRRFVMRQGVAPGGPLPELMR